MLGYSFSSKLSWPEYLNLKATDRSTEQIRLMRYDIESSNRQLIANNQQLHLHGISTVMQGFDSLQQGVDSAAKSIDTVSLTLDTLTRSFESLAGTVEWGFSNLLATAKDISMSLAALVSMVSTPTQTWALEQFTIAREAFSMGLREEALASPSSRFQGHPGQSG